MIIHAIASLQRAAGTSVFCAEVCKHIGSRGRDVMIATQTPNMQDAYVTDPHVRVESLPTYKSGVEILHAHALWSPFIHRAIDWAYRGGVPIVLSPHGMLTPWALRHNAWKKQLGLLFYQRADLARVTLFHATSESEVDDIRRMGLRQPIVVAPLGVDLPDQTPGLGPRVDGVRAPRIVLFISRIHPKKGLDMLLEAWARLKMTRPHLFTADSGSEWRLVIAGPDEGGHKQELLKLGRSLQLRVMEASYQAACAAGLQADVVFTGAVYAEDKGRLYAGADLFVLPSHSENFGAVVTEALAWRLPVVTTTGTPWGELEDVGRPAGWHGERRAGWWIDVSVAALTDALFHAMSLTDHDRLTIGENGRWLAERRYAWPNVACALEDAYDWVLGASTMPSTIC